MSDPTRETLIEHLAEMVPLAEAHHESLACKVDDMHRCIGNRIANARDILKEAGHEDYNPRVKLANQFEKIVKLMRGEKYPWLGQVVQEPLPLEHPRVQAIFKEIDFEQAAELMVNE